MIRRTVGIVDYGVGNHASVWRALHALGHRCRVSGDPEVLSETDLLLLPGVGAFPAAMAALHARGLAGYLQAHARAGRPMVGICLGMQLMADASAEHGLTQGLGLIPGQVVALGQTRWHIGWNTIEVLRDEPWLQPSDGQSLYFNHSYVFQAPPEYQVGLSRLGAGRALDVESEKNLQDRRGIFAADDPKSDRLLEPPFTVAVRRGNVLGLQFHPEKSQGAGRQLLRNVVEGMCRA